MKLKLLSFLSIFSISLLFAQYIDVVTLHDGSVIKGTIIEQKPGEYLKIETDNESVIKVVLDDVKLISKEKVKVVPKTEEPESRRDRRSEPEQDAFPTKDEFLTAGFNEGDYNRARSMNVDIYNYKLWKDSRNNAKTQSALKGFGIGLFAAGLVGAGVGYIFFLVNKTTFELINPINPDTFYFQHYFKNTFPSNSTKEFDEAMKGIRILFIGGGVFLVGTVLWIISGAVKIPKIVNRKGRRVSMDLQPYMHRDTQGLQVAFRF